MPKLEFPAYFENGTRGIRCTQEIKHNEAFLYVPYKMLITVSGTKAHKVLGPIIDNHPEVFDNRGSGEKLVIALRMLYEITLGKDSYWFPWLATLDMGEVSFTKKWTEEELEMVQGD